MANEVQAAALISRYMDLLRIEKADDMKHEVQIQLREARAQLEALGVVVDKLTVD